ncbi:MFS transporter [Streptomyces hainanensis]|uniref:MFS transporter n=1 Tax=Streptomyces hainanensis TaxID=402648 RepID=A0A4R4TIY8_9ACTN|nr:MFS transporter [Streptomyces hainanensis]TDC77828.1 MFS transporter [Streptomyces hainanensis]
MADEPYARANTAERTTAAEGPAPEPPRPPRGVLPALCLTSITSWGILYYAFPVLLSDITADTGWSGSACTAAFSAALLVSAGVGIPVGRLIDRRGPRAVMTGGSVLGAVAVLGLAAAPNLAVFAVAWLAVGVSMAATLYQPAFAAVARWWGPRRVRALTAITLAGGLASTVFAPLTAALAGPFGWRGSYLVLAGVLAAVTVLPHWLALRAPWPEPPEAGAAHAGGGNVARSRPFVLLATALTLSGCVVFSGVIALVPLLTERGLSASTAAWALGLGGAGQTLGRALYAVLARRTGTVPRTVVLIALGGVTTLALGLVPGPAWLLVVVAVLAGMVRGNVTLLQATAVPDRWGSAAYGRLSALLAAPVTVVGALTPFATAALAGPLGGYPRLFAWLAVLSVLAAALAVGTGVRVARGARRE